MAQDDRDRGKRKDGLNTTDCEQFNRLLRENRRLIDDTEDDFLAVEVGEHRDMQVGLRRLDLRTERDGVSADISRTALEFTAPTWSPHAWNHSAMDFRIPPRLIIASCRPHDDRH